MNDSWSLYLISGLIFIVYIELVRASSLWQLLGFFTFIFILLDWANLRVRKSKQEEVSP